MISHTRGVENGENFFTRYKNRTLSVRAAVRVSWAFFWDERDPELFSFFLGHGRDGRFPDDGDVDEPFTRPDARRGKPEDARPRASAKKDPGSFRLDRDGRVAFDLRSKRLSTRAALFCSFTRPRIFGGGLSDH